MLLDKIGNLISVTEKVLHVQTDQKALLQRIVNHLDDQDDHDDQDDEDTQYSGPTW
jgi:hypothetical protein